MTLATLRAAATRAAITDALRASGGVVDRAARALGVDPASLRRSLRHDPGAWPEGVPRLGAGRPRVPVEGKQVTDDELRAAVVEAGPAYGRWSRVAALTGLRRTTARARGAKLGL